MVDITTAFTTTLIGMMGVVMGAIVSNYFNTRLTLRNSRRDIIFKKKLEYFEGIIKCIENNTKLYLNSLREAEKKLNPETIQKIIKELKEKRRKFDANTSPLYIDTRILSQKIKTFVNIEKKIFYSFEKIIEPESNKNELVKSIKDDITILTKKGDELIFEMRTMLHKEEIR
jgi:hypothetical protein